MSRIDQQLTCTKVACDSQTLPMVGQQKNNIKGDIKPLMGWYCELEKVMRFLNDIGVFEKI